MILKSRAQRSIIFHKLKKVAMRLTLLFFVVALISLRLSAVSAQTREVNEQGFAGGSGSKNDPFLIETPKQLDNVRNYASNEVIININNLVSLAVHSAPAYYFKVIDDIDMADYLFRGGDGYIQNDWGEKGWMPIQGFKGVFDGGSHTIKNLWINRSSDNFVGLFGYCESSTIENIRLELSDKGIRGTNWVGGIAAKMHNLLTDKSAGLISGCSVTGSILAVHEAKYGVFDDRIMSYTGGIVGDIFNSTVEKCQFYGTVSGFCAVGGILGVSYKGDVSDCISYAQISLTSTEEHIPIAGAGGVVGIAYGSSIMDHGDAMIMNCFFDGYATDSRVAAIIGYANDIEGDGVMNPTYKALPNVLGCYYKSEEKEDRLTLIEDIVEFDNSGFGGEKFSMPFEPLNSGALSEKQLKDKANYHGWDFKEVWGLSRTGNPVLRSFGGYYDPPSLLWLYVTLGCALFGAAAVASGYLMYRRKKAEIVNVTNTIKEKIYVQTPFQCLPESLTAREREVAELILEGYSRIMIGRELFISESTVKKHIKSVFEKTGCTSQKDFIVKYK